MTVIMVNHGTVFISQITNGAQLRDRAVHREDTISGNQDPSRACSARLLQFGSQILHIIVLVAITCGFAEPDPVNNGGMVQLIRNHRIIGPQNCLE